MPEDSEHRFYRGTAGWIIIGIIAAIVVIFAVFWRLAQLYFLVGLGQEYDQRLHKNQQQVVLATIQGSKPAGSKWK